MGSQIYMTLGAMVLLSVFILSSNTLIQRNSQIVNESEYLITAISIAQNVLDEAKTKAFDEKLVSGKVSDEKDLTQVLGRENDETFKYPDLPDTVSKQIYNSTKIYDDFDDYNGYTRIVDTKRADSFKVSSIVQYVDPEDPDVTQSSPTFCKRITVIVNSPYLTTPVQLKFAMIY